MKYITTINEHEYLVDILDDHRVVVNGVCYVVDFESVSGQPVFSLLVDGKSYEAYVYESDSDLEVLVNGALYTAAVVDEREHRLRSAFGSGPVQSGEFYLKAPMPGLVIDIPVEDGQKIGEGDVLLILESMKMQNELKAPRAGVVSRVRVKVGENVERRQTLLSVI